MLSEMSQVELTESPLPGKQDEAISEGGRSAGERELQRELVGGAGVWEGGVRHKRGEPEAVCASKAGPADVDGCKRGVTWGGHQAIRIHQNILQGVHAQGVQTAGTGFCFRIIGIMNLCVSLYQRKHEFEDCLHTAFNY